MFTSRWAAVVATAALVAGCSGDGAGRAVSADAAAVGPVDARTPPADARPDRDAERPGREPDTARPAPDATRPDDGGRTEDAATPPDPDDGVPPPPSDAGPPPADTRATLPDVPLPDAAPPPAPPMITEFLARNADVIEDEDGEHSDYIELYNPSGAPRALLGWHLTDDPEDPIKWAFPDVTLVARVVCGAGCFGSPSRMRLPPPAVSVVRRAHRGFYSWCDLVLVSTSQY
jgi:hypothetical protein